MFKYRNKEYSSSSEALDDYIRNFDFQNYENELSVSLRNVVNNKSDQLNSRASDNRQKIIYSSSLKSCLLKNDTEIKEHNSLLNGSTNEDDLAIKKIESLINVLSNRIDEHKKSNNNAFSSDLDEINYNEMRKISELQQKNLPSMKLLDLKIREDFDVTNKQAESIKDSLFVFENINKKLNEANRRKTVTEMSPQLTSQPSSGTAASETKVNFINECMKLIDTDELLRFPTLAQLAQTTTGLQQNDYPIEFASNAHNKLNDSGLDCLLNEIKGALK